MSNMLALSSLGKKKKKNSLLLLNNRHAQPSIDFLLNLHDILEKKKKKNISGGRAKHEDMGGSMSYTPLQKRLNEPKQPWSKFELITA